MMSPDASPSLLSLYPEHELLLAFNSYDCLAEDLDLASCLLEGGEEDIGLVRPDFWKAPSPAASASSFQHVLNAPQRSSTPSSPSCESGAFQESLQGQATLHSLAQAKSAGPPTAAKRGGLGLRRRCRGMPCRPKVYCACLSSLCSLL